MRVLPMLAIPASLTLLPLSALAADLAVTTIIETGDALPGVAGVSVPAVGSFPAPFEFWPSTDGSSFTFAVRVGEGTSLEGLYRRSADGTISVVADPFGSVPLLNTGDTLELDNVLSVHATTPDGAAFSAVLPDGSGRALFLNTSSGTRIVASDTAIPGAAQFERIGAGSWTGDSFLAVARTEPSSRSQGLFEILPNGQADRLLSWGEEIPGVGTYLPSSSFLPTAAGDGDDLAVPIAGGIAARVDDEWSLIESDSRPLTGNLTVSNGRVAFRTSSSVEWWSPEEGLNTIEVGGVLGDGATVEFLAGFNSFAVDGDLLAFFAGTDQGNFVYTLDLASGELDRLIEVGVDTIGGRTIGLVEFGETSLENGTLAFTAGFGSGQSGLYAIQIPGAGTLPLLGVGVVAAWRRRRG